MSDYIKREEALSALCDPCAYKSACYSGDEIPACPALWTMLNIPAADVVERKKGEWIPLFPIVSDRPYCYECSNCGVITSAWSKFCPNCGADMRGQDAK